VLSIISRIVGAPRRERVIPTAFTQLEELAIHATLSIGSPTPDLESPTETRSSFFDDQRWMAFFLGTAFRRRFLVSFYFSRRGSLPTTPDGSRSAVNH
jgi:hypothetical protein